MSIPASMEKRADLCDPVLAPPTSTATALHPCLTPEACFEKGRIRTSYTGADGGRVEMSEPTVLWLCLVDTRPLRVAYLSV